MNNRNGNQIILPNPITYPQHRRQMWWQIIVPILVGAVILLILGIFSTRGSNEQVAHWGNISAIFLIIPFLITLLVTLAILGAIVYGLMRLLHILPRYTHIAQIYVDHYGKVVQNLADKIARPVIIINSGVAGVKAAARQKK